MKNRESIRESLRQVLSFASVQEPALPGMPFGKPVYDALKFMLSLGESFGFKTKNLEGYAGHIEWGTGEILGILTHLDVVPAGSDWTVPAYGATFKDGKIFGRGILDDKGPAVAVLYAMKELKDSGFVPNKKIRLIMGCNEESGWKCMDYYMSHEEMPALGFSPDGDFPVINCEKGVLHAELTFPNLSSKILSLKGGERVNMVPDRACAEVEGELPGGTFRDGKTSFFETGISSHGSHPDKGISAVFKLLQKLAGTDPAIGLLNEKLTGTFFGERCGLELSDGKSGRLTVNLGLIEKKGSDLVVELDIRYPVSYTQAKILRRLEVFGVPVKNTGSHDSLYVDPSSPLIVSLLSSYERVTGTKGECIAIGGATYARILKNGVAFGPVFPGEEATIHKADECVDEEKYFLMCDVYLDAIENLSK